MSMSAQEQLLLELTNRARLDPLAEAQRFGIDLNQGLPAGTIAAQPMQALAPNDLLANAAASHSQWMLATDTFSHTGAGGSNAGDRMAAAGYVFAGGWSWAENLAMQGTSGTLDLTAAIVAHHQGLFLSPGHRANTLNPVYRELGIGQEVGSYTGYNASMTTLNFATSGAPVFITGVVYRDRDGDAFYSAGEGVAGSSFQAQGATVATQAAGGYAIGVGRGASVAVSLWGGGVTGTVAVDTTGGNVKLDLVNGNRVLASADLTLVAGVNHASLLGAVNADLTGNAAGNSLIGSRGANVISGAAGDDVLKGQGGNDVLHGGAGNDTVQGGAGQDTAHVAGLTTNMQVSGSASAIQVLSAAGSDTFSEIETFVFSDRVLTRAELVSLIGTGSYRPVSNIVRAGGPGPETLAGAGGDDTLSGGGGNDTLDGGDGADSLDGGDGDDFIFAGATVSDAADMVLGGAGNDQIDGGYGGDRLFGESGNDRITGGAGNDSINAGGGNDLLIGGPGRDRLIGGAGADRFVHSGAASHGPDRVLDYDAAEGDRLVAGIAGATAGDFRVTLAVDPAAGTAAAEAFVTHVPTGTLLWAVTDGAALVALNLQIGSQTVDLFG